MPERPVALISTIQLNSGGVAAKQRWVVAELQALGLPLSWRGTNPGASVPGCPFPCSAWGPLCSMGYVQASNQQPCGLEWRELASAAGCLSWNSLTTSPLATGAN